VRIGFRLISVRVLGNFSKYSIPASTYCAIFALRAKNRTA
jgi:hypothetical protein